MAGQNAPESIMDEKPRWRIAFVDYEGPWGFNNVNDVDVLKDVLNKLKDYEGMFWREIEGHENHSISVTSICRDAKHRLSEINKEDYQDLFSFRLNGKHRLWGIKERDAFYILWWDPDHTVCPSIRKHT
jgi:hypothetical protein